MSSQVTGVGSDGGAAGEFGANEWLVEELYEQYKVDRNTVDPSWWPILDSYHKSSPPAGEAPPASAPIEVPPAPAAVPDVPTTTGSTPVASVPATGSQPVAKTTSIKPQPAPIPAQAPDTSSMPIIDADGDGEPDDVVTPLRGMAKTLATNMDASLTVPTATSVRTIPAKLMIDNRIVINNHLKRARGGKVSFTHLIAWAMVKAIKDFPSQNVFYDEIDGKPVVVTPAQINLGIAIDLPKPDGTRALMVPGIKKCGSMNFNEFLAAYEDVVKRARDNKLTAADFQGNTISLTNPGGIGTVHSVPRLMKGQGAIIGAGAL
ncbi:MAG: 2-oxo acid dehydrogenase subunit E2, partial [Microcella sp.]|nr:2-oxo acid dehydrogenase subunit E2 [Microcella sp.]